MKVATAAKMFSNTMSNGLHEYARIYETNPSIGLPPQEALPLAYHCKIINDLFDVFNSNCQEPYTGNIKCYVHVFVHICLCC